MQLKLSTQWVVNIAAIRQMQGYLFSAPRRARDVRGMLGWSKGKVENAA